MDSPHDHSGDPVLTHPSQADGMDIFIAQRVNYYDGLGTWRRMYTPQRRTVYENDDDVWHVTPENPAFATYAEGTEIREAVARYCLGGDTLVVTRDGLRPIRELAGSEPELLIPQVQGTTLKDRGKFRKAPVRQFGEQELLEITLTRDDVTKTILATAEHRWLTFKPGHPEKQMWLTTETLAQGMKFKSLRRQNPERTAKINAAVAQGFTFGDGSMPGDPERAAYLDIYDNGKDEAMIPYFPEALQVRKHHGVHTFVPNLPRFWNELPPIRESRAFLLSWLSGYFAADGTIDTTGVCSISSSKRENMEFVQSVAAVCGVGYRPIGEYVRLGIDGKYSPAFRVVLRRRDLPEWFFCIKEHAKRATEANAKKPGPDSSWRVVSVKRTGRTEPVYCATVEGVGAFALADDIMTGNCHTANLITVTTPQLGDLHREMSPGVPVEVLPNYIPEWVLDLERDDRQGHPRIGWCGGSSHKRDMQQMGDSLPRFMRRFPDWHCYVNGVDFRKQAKTSADRAFHIPWIPVVARPKLYYRSLDFDIGLAPLLDTKFAQAKSAVKILEYQSRGIVPVASDVEPYRRFITHGVDGFLVKQGRDHEWLNYMSLLATDEDLRAKMAAAGKIHAAEHVIEKHWHKWIDCYEMLFPAGWEFQGL